MDLELAGTGPRPRLAATASGQAEGMARTTPTAPAAAAGALAAAGGAAVAVKRTHDRKARRAETKRTRAYRLRPDEDPGGGVRRVARGQLDLAAEQLDTGPGGDLDGAVHEARKAFKRLRALVRVARDALGDDVYRRENTIFRDAGRRLSSARDAAVMVQTLDDLSARHHDELPDGAFAGLRDALASEAAAASAQLAQDSATVDEVKGAVGAARRRVAAWPVPDDGGLAMLEPGFERIYRRGRKALKAARRQTDTDHLHELRKRAKDLWHAAQVLRPAAPKEMRRLGRRAHALSDAVGEDHDLAVLRAAARERHATLAPGELALLEGLVARRRGRLQRKALSRARRIYARKPGKLAGLVS
jgi:CHAD domain-containing protein